MKYVRMNNVEIVIVILMNSVKIDSILLEKTLDYYDR